MPAPPVEAKSQLGAQSSVGSVVGGSAQSSFSVVWAGRASRPGCPGLAASGPRKRRACCASGKGSQRSVKKKVPKLRRSGLAVVFIWITDGIIFSPWQLLIRNHFCLFGNYPWPRQPDHNEQCVYRYCLDSWPRPPEIHYGRGNPTIMNNVCTNVCTPWQLVVRIRVRYPWPRQPDHNEQCVYRYLLDQHRKTVDQSS